MRTVLACVDFSDTSVPVLDEAARLADALGARVVLLHVQPLEPPYIGVDAGYIAPSPSAGVALKDRPGYARLKEAARRLEAPDRNVETVFVEGLIPDLIIDQADQQQADILVMGSHGHGALYHLLMGSVTESVLRRIHRPVLVVPAPESNE